MSEPRRVWLALGGNMGDRLAHLRAAVDALHAGGTEEGVFIDAVSSVYDTPAWGIEDQPSFANAAASGRSSLTPHALLALCKRIEANAGRDFTAPRNSARPIDLDILLVEDEIVSAPDLEVPHVAMHQRAFVLVPLVEIAPKVVHPYLDQNVAQLFGALPAEGRAEVDLIEGPGWWQPATSSI